MRPSRLLAAGVAIALLGGAARAGDPAALASGPVPAAAADQDDAFAAATAPAPRDQVRVNAPRPKPSPPEKMLVAATAPAHVFDDDDEGRRIDAFINGPVPPARPGEGEPPPCDETPHGEVGVSVGGGSHTGTSYGGYGTVVQPIMHCRGVVAISVSGARFGGYRR